MSFKLASFIAPVCNQGDEARQTIASAREGFGKAPHEFVVVDDHSLDGSCHDMPRDVLIVRTDRRDGVSSARRCGVEQARGDVLVWSDPHCRFPAESLAHLAKLAAESDGIVQPHIIPALGSRARESIPSLIFESLNDSSSSREKFLRSKTNSCILSIPTKDSFSTESTLSLNCFPSIFLLISDTLLSCSSSASTLPLIS